MATDYDRNLQQTWKEAGQEIGGILKDRWQTKQAEDFQQNEFQMFQQATSDFQNNLAVIEDGDQLAQAFVQWKNTTFMPFITNATAKYSGNERIMNMVQQVVDANNQGLEEYMSIEEAGHKRAGRDEAEVLETRQAESKLDYEAAGAEERRASAQRQRAMATATRREAKLEPLQREVIPREQLASIGLAEARQLINDPRFAEWKQAVDQKTDTAAVNRIITDHIGEEKFDGTKWGQNPERDEADAKRMWADSAMWQKTAEAARLQAAGYSLDRAQGYYDDVRKFLERGGTPLTPEEKQPPLKSSATDSIALGRIFATNTEGMRAQGWEFDNVKGFINNTLTDLPATEEGYRQLGPHVTSVLEGAAFRDADGTAMSRLALPNGEVRQFPIRNYTDLVKALRISWHSRVTDKQFAPDATRHRTNSRTLGNAIIRRFAPAIAQRIGLTVPKAIITQVERAGEPALLKWGRSAAEGVGRLLKEGSSLFEEEM